MPDPSLAGPTAFGTDIIFASVVAGAVGGVVGSINIGHANTVYAPFWDIRIRLGFLGDALIGAAAGVAILLLTATSTVTKSSDETLFKIVPLGILAGIAGTRLLVGMSHAILGRMLSEQEKLSSKVDALSRVSELVSEGEKLISTNPKLAEEVFKEALAIDQRNPVARLDLAKALRHQADKLSGAAKQALMQSAIDELTLALESSPRYDRAYYNRACYLAIVGASDDEVLSSLKQAILLFAGNAVWATTDPDLAKLRQNNEFQTLVSKPPSQ